MYSPRIGPGPTAIPNQGGSVSRLVVLGAVAAVCFASTFVINRWLSVGGGHWFWTASLRYGYVFVFATALLLLRSGPHRVGAAALCVVRHWRFWLVVGGVGFAAFYLALCYAASYAPGWVVATTWQLTIVASPIVLAAVGRPVPLKGVLFVAAILVGVFLVNAQEFAAAPLAAGPALLPVLLAAFCYPLGNTLCGLAKAGDHPWVPDLRGALMEDTFCRIWMMTAGALPPLAVVGLILAPPKPTVYQWQSTAFVAMLTGIVGTGLFLFARHSARSAFGVAAVDATQALEAPLALLIEAAVFAGAAPGRVALLGVVLVVGGVSLFAFERGPER